MATTNAQTFTIGGVTHQVEDVGARQLIADLQTALNAITSGDTTTAIKTFNEIIAFLDNIEDTSTLQGIIAGLNTSIAGKVDAVPGKGLSTNDFTTTLLNKLNNIAPGAQVNVINGIKAHGASTNLPVTNGVVELPEQTVVDLDDYYDKDEVDDAISQMEATIEQQQLTVITGDRLSLWLDEDGESINIMAGEVPDIAAAPTISHVINNDGTATVTIVNNEQGATIHYTTDGTAPTESSSVYSSQLTINTAGPHTIKAIAIIQDKMNSSVATDTFSVVSCQTPNIEFDDTPTKTAIVTATAGNDESVSLTIGNQTTTGIGSATMTINKGTSSQTLSATATATATGRLSASASESYTISAKVDHVFSAHKLGGKAVAGTTQGDIQVTLNSSFANQAATITEEDGVIWWEIDCENRLYNGIRLRNEVDVNSSIFSAGADKVLTIEHLPSQCTIIDSAKVFTGCTNIIKFNVGSSNLVTLSSPFAGNTSIEEVLLPSTVTDLNGAFDGCTALESVSAPGVTNITNGALRNCSSLTTASFGTITAVGANSFNGCSSFNFSGIDFSHATSIGNNAFKSCAGLTSIDLSSATTIGSAVFQSAGLTSVTLGDSLATIGGTAFYGCKMTSVDIPASVTSIGGSAFESSTHMKEFHIKKVIASSSEAATVSGNGLNKPSNNPTIYVPVGTSGYYEAAWTAYTSLIVEEPNS